jgi:hypothetical protein
MGRKTNQHEQKTNKSMGRKKTYQWVEKQSIA